MQNVSISIVCGALWKQQPRLVMESTATGSHDSVEVDLSKSLILVQVFGQKQVVIDGKLLKPVAGQHLLQDTRVDYR